MYVTRNRLDGLGIDFTAISSLAKTATDTYAGVKSADAAATAAKLAASRFVPPAPPAQQVVYAQSSGPAVPAPRPRSLMLPLAIGGGVLLLLGGVYVLRRRRGRR